MPWVISVLLLSTNTYAQTGPGGVGNTTNNGIWLRAQDVVAVDGDPITVWNDFSGNSNAAQQPTLGIQPTYRATSALNNQPVIRFDGNDDEMAIADADILDGTPGITYFAVVRPNNLNGAPRGILGKRITFTNTTNYAYTWFFWNGNRLNNDIETQNNRYNSGSNTFNNATNYVLSFDFDGTRPLDERSRMYSNGQLIAEAREDATTLNNSNQPVALGALNVGYNTYLGADYAEIIHFNYAVNTTQRTIINNYLAAKYGIGLTTQDLYVQDNAANGNFDFEVAGIGRSNASDFHDDAQGSAILRINNPSDLNNNEFLLWGHNNLRQEADNFADLPAGIEARFSRVWRPNEVNSAGSPVDVGAIDLEWNLTGLGTIDVADLRLLVDTDNDGFFIDETPIAGATAMGGDRYAFAGVTAISNNTRFTLATARRSITPLPIELLSFDAKAVSSKEVHLTWQTLTELNNAYFTVERSLDAATWEAIGEVPGAGNSASLLSYLYVDQAPYQGISYYRLKQTDFD
ncbi:MAG: hypothetical protein AAF734_09550, partial [Bacteroidota bacterium]